MFVSYSHNDGRWLKRLQVHLAPLVRSGAIDLWDDTRIDHGDVWNAEIEKALATTKVAILLISADFLASNFITSNELPPLLAAAESEGVTILPVIINASLFTDMPELSRFQSVNPPNEPLDGKSRAEQEILLNTVAQSVLRLISAKVAPADDTEQAELAPAQEPQVRVATGTGEFAQSRTRKVLSASDISDQIQAARELASEFAPERLLYLALISISVLIVLLGLGISVYKGAFNAPLTTAILGAGGLAFVFAGMLQKMQERTLHFIEQQSKNAVVGA